jgi:hypothetical protein
MRGHSVAQRALIVAAAAIALAPRAARADDTTPPPDVVDDPAAQSSKIKPPWFVKEGQRLKSVAVEMNPLAMAIGLFSMNVEVVPTEHHALVITPHYYYAVPGRDDSLTGGGFEAGYRYYTGHYGPHGFFVGGSFMFGAYQYIHGTTVDVPGFNVASSAAWDSYGAAIDTGYQMLINEHIVVGLGIGAQYRYFNLTPTWESDSHSHQDLLYGPGFRPRFLFAFGGAI